MVVVKTMLDCLDEAASRLSKDYKGKICSVFDWVFRNEYLDNSDLFSVFPTPGGPSINIGFLSKKDK